MVKNLLRFLTVICGMIAFTAFQIFQIFETSIYYSLILTFLLFIVMLGSQLVYRSYEQVFDHTWYQVFVWLGTFLIGLWSTFFILIVPVDIVHFITSLANASYVFPKSVYFYIFIMSLVLVLLGFLQTLMGPRVKEVVIEMPHLNEDLHNFRIAQISDLHIGPTIRSRYIKKVIRQINQLAVDIVTVTGDFIDAKASSVESHVQNFSQLNSSFGTYFATGNHEYYWGVEEILKLTSRHKIHNLINDHKIIQKKSASLMIAGVTDPTGAHFDLRHNPNLDKTLSTNQDVDFKLLLSHRPDTCLYLNGHKVDLQLSGHTHSGQYFPFSLFISLFHKYYKGLNLHEDTFVYVNPGTGYWGPANRLGVRAEITLIKLIKTKLSSSL